MKNFINISLLYLFGLTSCHVPDSRRQQDAILLSDSMREASCVYLTGDENNIPVVSWVETVSGTEHKYFFVAFWNEDKSRFGTPVSIPIEQNASIHEEGMPKIAVKGNGVLMAVYEVSAPTAASNWAGFIHYLQSTDNGKTWSVPECVHADTTGDKERSFAAVTRLANGEIGVCWLDAAFEKAGKGRPVKFAHTNGKSGFANEQVIDSLACECCRTAISSDDKGNINIVYRDILPGSVRDISRSTSHDNGLIFSHPLSFSNDDWVINGCPHNGPSVANNGKNTYATWFAGGEKSGLYYGELNEKGEMKKKTLMTANGRNIQLCLMPDGERIIVYNETIREGDSIYSKIKVSKIKGDAVTYGEVTGSNAHAVYPVVHGIEKNTFVACWVENGSIYYRQIDAGSITQTVQPISTALSGPAGGIHTVISLSNKTDPVCGMHVGQGSDTTLYKGKIIGFCNEMCKTKFLSKPASFEKVQ